MFDLFFSGGAIWFAIPALVGTLVFALRSVALLMGADHGLVHADVPGDVVGDIHADSTHSFEILSIQSLVAFAMGFGWAGLAALRIFDWSVAGSVATGAFGGAAMVWMIGAGMKAMLGLQTSGTQRLDTALGAEGEVYVTVPARGGGQGQVRIVVEERQRILNAVTDIGPIPTPNRVRVVKINEDNTVTVAAL
jgi:hypothetical protein